MDLIKKRLNRPKDTIGRILESSPTAPIEIVQTKAPKNKLQPWMSSQKELKFTFAPPAPPAAEPEPQPPAYTPEPTKPPIVQVKEQRTEQGLSLMQSAQVGVIAGSIAGSIAASLVVAGMWGKRAYDAYNSGEDKS